MRELDLAVLRHMARTRRAVAGGVRVTHYPIPERQGTLLTAAPARTVPLDRVEPGRPAYLRGAAPWLLGIHRAHGRYADDGLAVFDETCVFDAAVPAAVFTAIAAALLPASAVPSDRLAWHGITIRACAGEDVGDDPDLFFWSRHGAKARTGTAYVCPDDISFGLYLMYDGHRGRGMPAEEAAADARAWLSSGHLGSPVFPWPIGEGRPFDVARPNPPGPRRRRPRQQVAARA